MNIKEIVEYLEGQIADGYLDISIVHDEQELEIIREALELYKDKHEIK